MKLFEEHVSELVARALDQDPESFSDLVGQPPRPEMGDYAFPCFQLAKKLKKDPKRIAFELAGKLDLEGTPFSSVEAAGPYLNFRLDDEALAETMLTSIFREGDGFGFTDSGQGRRVVIDYSSPNIAKPFHIGHLRSTVIGAALYRISRAMGYEPIGINHLGDWGTQFGMVMAAFSERGDRAELERAPIAYSLGLYVDYNQRCEQDPEARDRARQWFKRLEDGDPKAVELWMMFRDLSLDKFKRIYERLGVSFDSYIGESFYNSTIAEALEGVERSGVLETSEDGARMIRLDDEGMPPFILRKSDGATLYATREIAAAFHRHETYGPELLLYVVGSPQELHFRQLKAALSRMGCDWAEKIKHVKFGHVHGMSTRRGEVVLLEEVLDEAAAKAGEKIEENIAAGKLAPDVDREALAEAVGIGALITNDLKHRRERDIFFDWEQVLNFDGETGPYLQYSYARIRGIIDKAGVSMEETYGRDPLLLETDFGGLCEPETRALLRKLADFATAVHKACAEFEPSLVTTYLFELTRAFNLFYTRHRVVGSGDKEQGRLLLVQATGQVIKNGLDLLGIPMLERM